MERSEESSLAAPRSARTGWVTRGSGTPTRRDSKRSSALDQSTLRRMLSSLGDPPIQLELWDGAKVAPEQVPVQAGLLIHDRGALLKLAAHPEFQFGEMYSSGRIEVVGDLLRFLELVYQSLKRCSASGIPNRIANRIYRSRRNTVSRARDNIHHHYDIGNDFYRLWLDRQMVYTCAYFPRPDVSLEQAQTAKMDHVARKLWLQPGERVVEAGCGWGALALHLARHYGVKVLAFNISREQLAYARERARSEGLASQVEFVEGDYREIRGEFDAFVSVGMLEHVGTKHYHELGEVVQRSLTENGRGLIHSIGRDHPGTLNSWIGRRIFPGAHPPSLSEMSLIFEPFGFSVLDVENLRLHYARTLEHWLERYKAREEQVNEMFDQEFVRAWRLYLAGSIAAFRIGTMQLFQVLFTRSGCNQIPWTREHLYRD